jgi:hypothetical protein
MTNFPWINPLAPKKNVSGGNILFNPQPIKQAQDLLGTPSVPKDP